MIDSYFDAVYPQEGADYRTGDMIVALPGSPWEGLYGTITEIRGSTEPQVLCEFLPPVLPAQIRKLEKRFSQLNSKEMCLADLELDRVILPPEWIRIVGNRAGGRKLSVYIVREEWALDGDHDLEVHPYLDPDEARLSMLSMIREDMECGCISSWQDRGDLDCELKEDSYEYWLHDSYHENHYLVTLTTRELWITDPVFRKLENPG